MTPELKANLHKFLWDEAMLYDEGEEMELIEKWIDDNILKDHAAEIAKYGDIAKALMDAGTKIIELKTALKQSLELIKQWHSRSIPMAGKLRTVVEDVWHTYLEFAPEMEGIREALKEGE